MVAHLSLHQIERLMVQTESNLQFLSTVDEDTSTKCVDKLRLSLLKQLQPAIHQVTKRALLDTAAQNEKQHPQDIGPQQAISSIEEEVDTTVNDEFKYSNSYSYNHNINENEDTNVYLDPRRFGKNTKNRRFSAPQRG